MSKHQAGSSPEISQLMGTQLQLKHYSSDTNTSGQVINIEDNNIITILPSDTYIVCSYFEDDPIVLIFDHNNQICSCQTYISSIDYKTGEVKLKIHDMNLFSNRRKHNRYPTSLFATILGTHEMETSYVSNISESGISIMSGAIFEEGDVLEIEADFKEVTFKFKSTVVWSRELSTINEYGLNNISCQPTMKKIIKLIDEDMKTSSKANN